MGFLNSGGLTHLWGKIQTALAGKMDISEYGGFGQSGLWASDVDGVNGIQMYPDGILLYSGDNWMKLGPDFPGVIDSTGGTLVTSNTLGQRLENKQDKLTGSSGQFVGFDSDGALTAVSNPASGKVSGQGVSTIRALTQAQYDALTTKGTTTLYLIKEGA